MKDRGITLTELLVVISVVCILAVALGFSYYGWLGTYKVESQVKTVYSDLLQARAEAMQNNRYQFFRWLSSSRSQYYRYDDTTPAPNGDGVLQSSGTPMDTLVSGYPKTVQYPMTWGNGHLILSKRGMISTTVNPDNPPWTLIFTGYSADANPDYNCILMSVTTINMGKMDAGNCVIK